MGVTYSTNQPSEEAQNRDGVILAETLKGKEDKMKEGCQSSEILQDGKTDLSNCKCVNLQEKEE